MLGAFPLVLPDFPPRLRRMEAGGEGNKGAEPATGAPGIGPPIPGPSQAPNMSASTNLTPKEAVGGSETRRKSVKVPEERVRY